MPTFTLFAVADAQPAEHFPSGGVAEISTSRLRSRTSSFCLVKTKPNEHIGPGVRREVRESPSLSSKIPAVASREWGFHSPDFIFHSMVRAPQYSDQSIKMPVITLTTAMARLQHKHIDVQKMDIEGGEHSVLADLAGKHVPVRQMCGEFQHRSAALGVQKTRAALSLLNNPGLDRVHACPRFQAFSPVKTGVV
jgi:hypothetical protein